MPVVLGDVVVNGGDELVHAAKHAAAQALDGEIAKESLGPCSATTPRSG